MVTSKKTIFLLAIILSFYFVAYSEKILVIFDNAKLKQTHSQFLSILQSPRNNKTKDNLVQVAYSFGPNKIELKNFDRFKYDSIVVMCTSEKQVDSKIKVKDIINYFDQGGNVIIVGDIDTSVSFRKLFYSFGVNLDQTGTRVKDYFSNYNRNDIVSTDNYQQIAPFFSQNTKKPLLYRGTGLQLVNYQNYQLFNLLKAQPTTFAKNQHTGVVSRAGSQISFIAGVQGLNNARALISGGLDFFSNELINQKSSGNQQAVRDLIAWTFRKNGQVRVNSMTYFGQNAQGKQTLFNVGQKIYFEAEIQQVDQKSLSWKPYVSNDLQVQFVMLDPWVRIPLVLKDQKSGKYQAQFYAPQKQGIYQFKIIYKRPGYNFISQSQRVTLRPYKHDQFQRFLFVAYPYFFGLFSTVIATFAFVIIYLYSSWQDNKPKQE